MYKFSLLKKEICLFKETMSSLYHNDYGNNIDHVFKWLINYNFKFEGNIIDIGSNIGLYSLAYKIIFPKAKITAFEPVLDIFKISKKNMSLNSSFTSDISIVNMAVSDKKGNLNLGFPYNTKNFDKKNNKYFANSGLISAQIKKNKPYLAQSISIDEYVKFNKLSKIDFIKIDVEGHEYQVLTGLVETIKNNRPIIIFEFNKITRKLSNFSINTYVEFINKIDYEIYGLRYGWAEKLDKLDLSIMNKNTKLKNYSDLIIFPLSR